MKRLKPEEYGEQVPEGEKHWCEIAGCYWEDWEDKFEIELACREYRKMYPKMNIDEEEVKEQRSRGGFPKLIEQDEYFYKVHHNISPDNMYEMQYTTTSYDDAIRKFKEDRDESDYPDIIRLFKCTVTYEKIVVD